MIDDAESGDPIFRPQAEPVHTLTRRIHTRELGLPNFQRSFVWDATRTVRLLGSIMARYPAGTLLLLDHDPAKKIFQPREFEGAPALGDEAPKALVLDGQQRLTALYRARYGYGEERLFVVIKHFFDIDGNVITDAEDIEWDEAVVALERAPGHLVKKEHPEEPDAYQFDTREWQLENWHFPVDQLRVDDALDEFLDALSDKHGVIKKDLRGIRRRYMTPLQTYAFPVVTLPADTRLPAVVTIFETINQTGVPLGPFELLTARFWTSGIDLRALWDKATDDYSIIEEFGIDPYSLLQAVCLRTMRSAQRSDVLSLKADAINEHWDSIVRGFAGSLEMLQSECGVLTTKWLPYGMVLVPMASVWHRVESAKGAERGKLRQKLEQYFWCTVFMTNYDQGANSQAGADHARLDEWLTGSDKAPEAVAEFAVTSADLRSARTNRRALYRGVMALTVRHGGKDFHNTQRLTAPRLQERKIDAHHVFPKKWITDNEPLGADGLRLSSELIVNRALIDRETNRRIKARPPSQYLAEIRSDLGDSTLSDILDSHLLPAAAGSSLDDDDYRHFVEERLELVAAEIEDVTGKSVARIPPPGK